MLDEPESPIQSEGQEGEMKKILLVDDDIDWLAAVEQKFGESFIIIKATGTSEAVNLLALHRNDIRLIVSDLNMPPDKTGLDLLMVVRSLGYTMPFIIVTADRDFSEDNIKGWGAQVFHKPISTAALSTAVNKALVAAAPNIGSREGSGGSVS